jgi:hypothetical protein
MIRRAFLFFFQVLFTVQLMAQVVITSDDMPVPGDTVRKSITTFLEGFDYQASGPDRTWYFDELTVMSQQVDTFISVEETPGIYQLFFNNQFIYPAYKATVVQKLATFAGIPGMTLTDSYLFIKNTAEEYREVGYGVTLEGIQIPVQLQEIDTIYRFPLQYGNVDSAQSLLEVDIPDLGFLMIAKSRRNTVDGYGTLITPYGEFQTLRVKTEITEYDSIYSDSLGIGIPVTRNITEYKWLANGYPQPMLVVSEEPFIVTATYIDSRNRKPVNLTSGSIRTRLVNISPCLMSWPKIRKWRSRSIQFMVACSSDMIKGCRNEVITTSCSTSGKTASGLVFTWSGSPLAIFRIPGRSSSDNECRNRKKDSLFTNHPPDQVKHSPWSGNTWPLCSGILKRSGRSLPLLLRTRPPTR